MSEKDSKSKPGTIVVIFDHIPGARETWRLAVFAVSVSDARQAIKSTHRGGRMVEKIDTRGARVSANCGMTTEAAALVIRRQNEKMMESST